VRVEGVFGVTSADGWRPATGGMIAAEGEWALTPPPRAVDELVTDGYPFLRTPFEVVTEIHLRRPGRLRFEETDVDAIGLEIDGRWRGWVWERDGEYVLPDIVGAGTRHLRARLIPNGYNAYGPHHYVHGDAALISPDQIVGQRGFADPPGTPPVTHDAAWRFRRMRVPATISVLEG
jgi:hypothetical protein